CSSSSPHPGAPRPAGRRGRRAPAAEPDASRPGRANPRAGHARGFGRFLLSCSSLGRFVLSGSAVASHHGPDRRAGPRGAPFPKGGVFCRGDIAQHLVSGDAHPAAEKFTPPATAIAPPPRFGAPPPPA